MNRTKGIATLVTVTGTLLIVAMFAVAVANSGFGEIKKAQNLIADAKQRANARAGLDCAIALFERKEPNPDDINFQNQLTSECGDPTSSSVAISNLGTHWSLTSASGFATYGATIKYFGAMSAAAFKTSGSLSITGGNKWIPAKGELIKNDNSMEVYACSAIIAGGTVTIDVGDSNAKFETYLPESNLKCEETNYSTVVEAGAGAVSTGFEKDITQNASGLNIFKDLFGAEKTAWEKVKKDNKFYEITTGIATSADEGVRSSVVNCGASIKDAINGDRDLIWVTGDCLLDGLAVLPTSGVDPFIVIQNGIVGAGTTINGFEGTILQFTVDYAEENFVKSWGAVKDGEQAKCLPGAMSSLCAQQINKKQDDASFWGKLPFYFYGAFVSKGAYIVDIPDSTALINGSFVPSYTAATFEKPIFTGVPLLVKGSIHDF